MKGVRSTSVREESRPTPSSPGVSIRMQRQARRDTAPERALRSALHRLGLRFRVHVRPVEELRREADLLFRSARLVVFVDGCFWHGCPEHASWPKTNAVWWREKIAANRARDAETDERLRRAGWTVIRMWEHEDPVDKATEIAAVVRTQRGRLTTPGQTGQTAEKRVS